MNFFERLNSHLEMQAPVVYVDVGAMGGVPGYWRRLGPHCRMIAFEPDEREFEKLKNSESVTYLPYALGAKGSRELAFYVAKDAGKSSVYRPNMNVLSGFPDAGRYATVQTVRFPGEKVKSLDEALALHQIKGVDFIKLDTQGSELGILKGAQSALPEVFGCEIEVEFCELYEGQPLFADVDAFMRGHGFELVDLRRAFWKRAAWGGYIGRGQLVFGDALYFRRPENFLERLAAFGPGQRLSKIARALAVCMVYRLPDYAADLLNKARDKKYMDEAKYRVFMDCLRQEASGWGAAGFFARPFLARVFNRLSESLRPVSHLGFSDGDRHIGNVRNI